MDARPDSMLPNGPDWIFSRVCLYRKRRSKGVAGGGGERGCGGGGEEGDRQIELLYSC